MLKNYHILKISFVGPTAIRGSRVRISSDRFECAKMIPFNHSISGGTCAIAEQWLKKNGFRLTGKGEGKNCYFIITSTFKPL